MQLFVFHGKIFLFSIALALCTGTGFAAGDADGATDADRAADGAAEARLADYFGFESLETIRVGREAGPVIVADMNGNGLNDLVVVNNFASRIEIHYQKPDASPDDPVTPPTHVNEFPEHWRFNREHFSITHRVTAIVAHDFDGDGMMDLIYAGQPAEIVFVRQTSPGTFRAERRHRVRNLNANRKGMAIANVIGDEQPELLALVGGEIHIWSLPERDSRSADLGTPLRLTAGTNMTAFLVDDFTGNGANDVVGLIPDDSAPIRMWPGERANATRNSEPGTQNFVLGPQMRFEMPTLRTLDSLRLPGFTGARLAAIEQSSRRIVSLEVVNESAGEGSTGIDAGFHVHSFTDPGSRKRNTIITDLSGNGLPDVVTTDTQSNAIVVFRQERGRGLLRAQSHPSLAEIDYVAGGVLDPAVGPELFVLSEREGVVGRSPLGGGESTIPFPKPIQITEGHTPVAMRLVELDGKPHLAVIAKSDRDHVIDLIDAQGERRTVKLGSMTRSPETILAVDADQDGRTDLLLLTRDRPMIMLRASDNGNDSEGNGGEENGESEDNTGFTVIESAQMGQFGLVQAAHADNTATFDIDGNGHAELLIADRNYLRAVRYDPNPPAGISPGWQVVRQINADDPSARLVSISILDGRIFTADREGNRILIIERGEDGGDFRVQAVHVRGFSLGSIHAGAFSGDDRTNVVALGADGFAVIDIPGPAGDFAAERYVLRETDAWRAADERQLHFEVASGDVNADGLTDLIALDAAEQTCDIFTFTRRGRLKHATSFKVYESRIFTGGQAREFQPNQAIIADVTGNGAKDMILVTHDRVLIYPQMVKPVTKDREEVAAQ